MGRLKNKRGRPTKYRATLKSNPYWEEVRRAVRMRDGHRCTMCGKAYDLEIHHKTYNVNEASIVGREMDFFYCLTTLCEDCHAKVHNK